MSKRVIHVDGAVDVADFAAGLKEAYLYCRELGHNWKPWIAHWSSEIDAYERALRCARCRCERWQTLSRSGSVLSDNRKYPDGYLAQGLGRIVGEGRDTLRLESITRSLTEE